MKNRVNFALGVLVLFITGCRQPSTGGEPFELTPAMPQKRLLTNSTPVEVICYLDAERYNPLNVKDYIFTPSADIPETPFFNYAVLGYAYLAKDNRGYIHLELTGALKYILDNSLAFIKPLHQKGIQVLVEVRSGNFTENHEGIGLGLGTLDIPGINQLIEEFKILIKQYGIDGFEFNDIGGGKTAYSPDTKNIKQFRSDNPLYDESLFKDENGDALTSDEIAAVLWREGGSNLSNLIQMTNESLKETYTTPIVYEENEIREVRRSVLVRDTGHGSKLLSQLRMAYMPDAYSGADPKVQGNLKYIVHGVPYEYRDHASLYDEAQNRDFGEDADNQYAPFTVDLRDKKPSIITNLLIDNFVGTFDNPNRYGGLYFINLPPVSEDSEILDYVSRFSMGLFGRRTTLREVEGAGDYRKTW